MNLYHAIAKADPASPCIVDATGAVLFTYGDMFRESARMAAKLGHLGLAEGDRVAVQVEKSPEAMVLYLACLRRGLIYLPLNTAYGEHELAHFVSDAEPALIVCDPAGRDTFAGLAGGHVLTLDAEGNGDLMEALGAVPADEPVVDCADDDVASILYTSGTTGKPKGAMITHGNLISNGETLRESWGFTGSDVLLHGLPIFHVHGLFVAANLAMLTGATMIYLPGFNTAEVISLLPRATVYMGVPTHYTRMLGESSLDRDACANMRLFTSGSAPLLPATFAAWSERTGHTILERYGMTETGMNTSNPLDGERKPGTVGPPLPGVEARILDDAGNTVGLDEPGALEVRGPNVFSGYWRLPDKTAEEFTDDGFFRTGDVASLDADGYVSIIGRNKDLVITGGLNVYPVEIESMIDRMAGVLESAVIGVPHPDFGEAVTAVVVREGAQDVSERDVITWLKDNLANFKVAKRVHFVDALPRNTMGKVQKNVLRDRFGDA